MTYVGELEGPWDVPAKQAVEKMQVIWDRTDGIDYKITESTPVYQKVRGRYELDHKLISISRPSNASPTRGEASLVPMASLSFSRFLILMTNGEIRTKHAYVLRMVGLMASASHTGKLKAMIKRCSPQLLPCIYLTKNCVAEMEGAVPQPFYYSDARFTSFSH
jgi:hypothetical protein